MAQKRLRPEPPCQAATGPEMLRMPTLSVTEHSAPLPTFQAEVVAARFRLSAEHARVVAHLAFGEART